MPANNQYSDSAFSEVYEIVRTVEIVLASGRTFRLEVVKTEKGLSVPPYHVVAYERLTLYRAGDGSITSDSMVPRTVRFHVWMRDLELPSYTFHRDTPEGALSVALNLLSERRNNQNCPW